MRAVWEGKRGKAKHRVRERLSAVAVIRLFSGFPEDGFSQRGAGTCWMLLGTVPVIWVSEQRRISIWGPQKFLMLGVKWGNRNSKLLIFL